MYTISNNTEGSVSVAGLTWGRNESKTLTFINQEIIDAVETKRILASPTDLTPLTGLSALTNTMSVITDSSGGTAATITDGAVTIPAVTGDNTVKNAISTLVAELNLAKDTINLMATRMALFESMLISHESNLIRSSP